MILEVGCSNATNTHLWRTHFASEFGHADVSIDLTLPQMNYKIPNFIMADAHHLPFRDNTFTHVFCSHVIEHVTNPFRFLKELVRVGRNIKLMCPHRYSAHAKVKGLHLSFFHAKWFQKAFETIGGMMYTINTTLGLFGRPDELVVEAHKIQLSK